MRGTGGGFAADGSRAGLPLSLAAGPDHTAAAALPYESFGDYINAMEAVKAAYHSANGGTEQVVLQGPLHGAVLEEFIASRAAERDTIMVTMLQANVQRQLAVQSQQAQQLMQHHLLDAQERQQQAYDRQNKLFEERTWR